MSITRLFRPWISALFAGATANSLLASNAALPEARTQDFPWMSAATWQEMHAQDVALAEAGGVDLLFVGDSITEGWEGQPQWKEIFLPMRAANFGVGGDTTQNVLWRLDHWATGKLQPKAIVLLIGTNNFGRNDDSPADIVRGITAIVDRLCATFPEARVLVHGIFPRDHQADAPIRARIAKVNRRLRGLDDGQRIFVRDIGAVFLEPDGSLSPEVAPDFLHLSAEGYRRWAAALLPVVEPWLK